MQVKSSEMRDLVAGVDNLHGSVESFRQRSDTELKELREENAELKERIEILEAADIGAAHTGGRKSAAVKAFEHFVRTGDRSGLGAPEGVKAMSIGGGAAAGGAFVPEEIASGIVSRAIARSRLVSLVRNTGPFTSDYVRLVNLRGATAAWSSESGTRNATGTPTLREIRPTHGELYSYPSVTRWLAEDSQFNVEAFLRENVGDQFSKSLENAVLLGDGANKPTGIMDSAPVATADGASPERDPDTIEYISGTSDLADDVISLYFGLKPEYRARGTFVMSSATLSAVRKLRDSGGSGYLWQQNLSASVDASDGLLLGRPIATSEYMDTVGQSPALNSILFGDFDSGYELTRIGGMVGIRDDITVPGTIKLYIAQRWGGRIVDNDAIKSLKA